MGGKGIISQGPARRTETTLRLLSIGYLIERITGDGSAGISNGRKAAGRDHRPRDGAQKRK